MLAGMAFATGAKALTEQQPDFFLKLLEFVVFVSERSDKVLILFNQQ